MNKAATRNMAINTLMKMDGMNQACTAPGRSNARLAIPGLLVAATRSYTIIIMHAKK